MAISNIRLASLSLESSSLTNIITGSPNSIKIIGEFKAQINKVSHANLVRYVDCFRNKNGEF